MRSFNRLGFKLKPPVLGIGMLLLLVACSTTVPVEVESTPFSASDTGTVEPTEDEASTRLPEEKYDDFELVTLLPRDAIPAIDSPQFLEASEADRFYDPSELVMGVEFNGETRAYSVPFLSGHEIVNDTVGGVKIAVTW